MDRLAFEADSDWHVAGLWLTLTFSWFDRHLHEALVPLVPS